MSEESRPKAAHQTPAKASDPSLPETPGSGSAARRRDRIKLLLGSMVEQQEKVLDLVREAQDSADHEALGYASWTAYAAAEFGDLLAELGRDDRRLAVATLAETMLPTRAIASIVGVNQSTVARDLQVMHAASPGADDEVSEQDLEAIPDAMIDSTEEEFEDALTAARATGDLSQQNVVSHLPERRVTGLDGKSHPASREPRKPSRRPLPDQYRSAVRELTKAVERLERLQADDRFASHRAELAEHGSWTVGDLAGRAATLAQQLGGESG